MVRYIDADSLIIAIRKEHRPVLQTNSLADIMCARIEQTIREQPTAEVAEVVHGYWKDGIYCSVCGDLYDTGEYTNARNYCPNCGAKMEGRTVESSYAKVLKSYQEQLIQSYGENFIDECVKYVAKSYKGSEEKKMNQSRGEKK